MTLMLRDVTHPAQPRNDQRLRVVCVVPFDTGETIASFATVRLRHTSRTHGFVQDAARLELLADVRLTAILSHVRIDLLANLGPLARALARFAGTLRVLRAKLAHPSRLGGALLGSRIERALLFEHALAVLRGVFALRKPDARLASPIQTVRRATAAMELRVRLLNAARSAWLRVSRIHASNIQSSRITRHGFVRRVGTLRASPSAKARALLTSGGLVAVWTEVHAI
jgi:hypothetical protein